MNRIIRVLSFWVALERLTKFFVLWVILGVSLALWSSLPFLDAAGKGLSDKDSSSWISKVIEYPKVTGGLALI